MIEAANKFSPYAIQIMCALGDGDEGSGCCMRDQSDKDPMGGWCVYYTPIEDHRGNKTGYDQFHTYRLTDADFDRFENSFDGNGSAYELGIADNKLPDEQGGNNLQYIHLFAGEVDADGEHWTGKAFQPDYHIVDQTEGLSITTGFPRFGADNKVKTYYIDRTSTVEPMAMRVESVYLMGAISNFEVCSLMAITLALAVF